MKTVRVFSIVLLAAMTGCATTGNPIRQIAEALYGSGDIQDYHLPEGWGLAFAPVDAEGRWIEGVAGYVPHIFPVTPDAAASFIPAAYLPAHRMMPPPAGGPPPPLRPAPEALRPELEDLVKEATDATQGVINDRAR